MFRDGWVVGSLIALAVAASCGSDDETSRSGPDASEDGSAGITGTGGSAGNASGGTSGGGSGGADADADADVTCPACGVGQECAEGHCVPITWSRRYPIGQGAEVHDVGILPNGPYVAFGSTLASLGRDAFVIAFDTTGVVSFARTITGGGINEARSGDVTPDGQIVFCGGLEEYGTDAFVAKMSAAGELSWAQGLGGTSQESVVRCRASSDGGVWVAGDFWVGTTHKPFVAKLAADGSLTWARQIEKTALSDGLAATSDGGAILVGGAGMSFELKLDAQGTPVWARDNDFAAPVRIASASDGSVCLAASAVGDGVAIAKLGADGEPQWTREFFAALFVGGPTAVGVIPNGGCIVSADTPSGTWLLATTPQGALDWSKHDQNRLITGIAPVGSSGWVIGGFDPVTAAASLEKSDPLGEIAGCASPLELTTDTQPTEVVAMNLQVSPLALATSPLPLTLTIASTDTTACN